MSVKKKKKKNGFEDKGITMITADGKLNFCVRCKFGLVGIIFSRGEAIIVAISGTIRLKTKQADQLSFRRFPIFTIEARPRENTIHHWWCGGNKF